MCIWYRCSPFFSIMAMPNIHFFAKSSFLAISFIGISLYIITASSDLESTVALRKSSSLSIISDMPL